MNTEIGKRLEKILAETGLSQRRVALKAGLSPEYLSLIISKKITNIGIEKIEAIAEALNIHPAYLLYGKGLAGEPPPKITDELGPLNQEERRFILKLRKVPRSEAKKAVENILDNFINVP